MTEQGSPPTTGPIGILSDAHGNAEGLFRCLTALRKEGATSFRYLGDAVGYMPEDDVVVRLLAEWGADCVQGNHERMLLAGLEYAPDVVRLARVGAHAREVVATWPKQIIERLDCGTATFQHEPDPAPSGWVFHGHSHRPSINGFVVNVGSCGLPRDHGGLASCVLFTPTRVPLLEILRVPINPPKSRVHPHVAAVFRRRPKAGTLVGRTVVWP